MTEESFVFLLGWIVIALAVGLSAWALCLATARSTSVLRGWPGTLLGAVGLALAALALHDAGLGGAEALAHALGLLMFALPCVSALMALRRRKQQPQQQRT